MTARASNDANALFDKHVVVCVGTGGVGKTTTAAAIALAGARAGRRALVLTVDPARRLADALGAGELGGEPQEVGKAQRSSLGIAKRGALFAMMLDTAGTFDSLVERFASDAEARDRIRSNTIYQHLSDALAGSAEYAAMEQVYSLLENDDFDLIVVDTPPSQHALDFLEAPARMLEFLDSRIVQSLVQPAFAAGRFGLKVFQRGVQRVLQLVERVSGVGFLEDLTDFLLAMEGMSGGFKERALSVQERLLGPDTAFVLVAAPTPHAATAARRFLDQLDETGAQIDAIVLNRVHDWPVGDDPGRATTLVDAKSQRAAEEATNVLAAALTKSAPKKRGFDADAAAVAARNAAVGYARQVERDRAALAPLEREASARACMFRSVPELSGDVHDLEGLQHIANSLFERAPARRQRPTPKARNATKRGEAT